MKNRIICLLLAVIMCLACLAGCVGGAGGDSTDGGDDSSNDDTANNNNGNTNNGNTDNGGNKDDDANTDNGGNNDNTNDDNTTDDEEEDDDDLFGGGDEEEDAWWEDITYSSANLIFRMTNCTNKQELPSGCSRYLAGDDETFNDQIDEKVRTRNENAEKYTKVTVKYIYYPDTFESYGYSLARNEIINEIDNGSKETRPDIFCNWMTDMLLCSLKGKFENVMAAESKHGENYFDINLTKDAEENQYGYMTDLMRSLTLNKGQVYVIASDYFIDLIRAFFVVPVNVNLFNQAVNNGKLNPALTDYDKNGKVDINDFFYEVEAGKWTYDRLVQYSQAIYTRASGGTAESANDVLGFALGANGLPAAGMIYTSSVEVIKQTYDTANEKWIYTYPDSNPDLKSLMDKISSMMGIDGILCMDATDAGNLGLSGDEKTALLGIREKFVNNTLLFGGVILVGSLEFDKYQNMKNSGGFGVVPVPVYKSGDNYLTQIHVVGRAGGIAYNTEKFVQCSAFLQYQTQNSTAILNHYYTYNLSYGTAGSTSAGTGNVRMLTYIRNNVRTSFDKLFEDAIGFFFTNGIDDSNRYHTMLANAGYKFDNFADKYGEFLTLKQTNLASLEKEYANLPK